MYPTSAGWPQTLTGDIALEVAGAVWLGSRVTVPELVVEDGRITSELSGGQVQTSVDLTVADPTSELWTGRPSSPLHVLGQRVRLTSTVLAGRWSEMVPEGTFRLNQIAPTGGTRWRLYTKTGQWVRGPQVLNLSCGDLLDQVADERFVTPMSPLPGATVASEVGRLLAGILPVGASVSTLSRPVPASVTYDDQDRLGSLVELLRVEGRVLAVDRAGVVQAIPATGSGQVWRVPTDALIEVTPTADRAELRNAVVVTSETESREPLRGQAVERLSPLAWGGPFGRVPRFHHSPVLSSNAACNAAAATMLRSEVAGRRQTMTITCGTDPSVDVLDTALIHLPSGQISGLVTRIERGLLERAMRVTCTVDWGSVHA